MAALKPAEVDISTGRIEVLASVSEVGGRLVWGPPKTRRGRRTIVLPSEVVEELSHHLEHWEGDETVFSAPRGGPLRATAWRRRFWHPAVQKADLTPLRPYDLRHTAIAFWIEAWGQHTGDLSAGWAFRASCSTRPLRAPVPRRRHRTQRALIRPVQSAGAGACALNRARRGKCRGLSAARGERDHLHRPTEGARDQRCYWWG